MDKKRMKIAWHETGHAVMALRYQQKIQKVSLNGTESLWGGEKYLAFMKLDKVDRSKKITVEKAMQKIMIALGGYAAEILYTDGTTGIGGDDLKVAVDTTKDLLQLEEFRSWLESLPMPPSSALEMIENTSVRKYIHLMIDRCVVVLSHVRPVIQEIAEELYLKDELSGEEILQIFDAYISANMKRHQH